MEKLTIKASPRTVTGKKVKTLRQKGELPTVVYGHGFAAQNFTISSRDFVKTYKVAGDSSLIDLDVGKGELLPVLIQDVSYNPLTGAPVHVDFRKINMEERLTAKIALKFVGEARAIKELGGIFLRSLSAIEVECLPKDLVHEIEVDISPLNEFGDVVRVRDIKLPPGMKAHLKPEDAVATVIPPRSEEELAALSGAVEEKVEEVKTVAEEKKAVEEETKAAEGEAGEKK